MCNNTEYEIKCRIVSVNADMGYDHANAIAYGHHRKMGLGHLTNHGWEGWSNAISKCKPGSVIRPAGPSVVISRPGVDVWSAYWHILLGISVILMSFSTMRFRKWPQETFMSISPRKQKRGKKSIGKTENDFQTVCKDIRGGTLAGNDMPVNVWPLC